MDKARKISWQEYSRYCQLLAKRAQEEFNPQIVVGIARGGVIVGATISSILKLDFFPIKFSRRVNEQVVRKRPKLVVPPTADLSGKKIFLVDDWSDTGQTIKMAVREIKKLKPAEIKSAVLVRKGEFQPDYYAIFSRQQVIFPWEEEISQEPEEKEEQILEK